jgi:hypothetical protein
MATVDVTMLLCDAAAESGGKLYVLGGGWSLVRNPNVPLPMALAIKVSVPWDQANVRHKIELTLVTEDGESVDRGEGPIQVEGLLEVGRPAGVKPGTPLDSPFVLTIPPLSLPPGGYVWELQIEDSIVARAPFRVLSGDATPES